MNLLTLMDAIQVHAAAAAIAAGGSTFHDVAVGFPAARGRCVRIFYGGERRVEHFTSDKTLNSALLAEAIIVRGYWPLSETAVARHRAMEGEMSVFVKQMRTRILGDSQLGGAAADLNMSPFVAEQVIIPSVTRGGLSKTQYAIVESEIVVDYSEYPIAP